MALVQRELKADDVRVLAGPEEPPSADNVLHARLADGRILAVAFSSSPETRDVLERRLDMLVSTFSQSLDPSDTRGSKPPPRSLHQELLVLATRANAVDALVIDANSPMVWGSATERAPRHAFEDSIRLIDVSAQTQTASNQDRVRRIGPREWPEEHESREDVLEDRESGSLDRHEERTLDEMDEIARKATEAVRTLPGIAGLAKGRLVHHVERDNGYYLARSFLGIYLLVLVFDAPFDELRAERATQESLPRIERLVAALPPLDPEPPLANAGIVPFRKPRRR